MAKGKWKSWFTITDDPAVTHESIVEDLRQTFPELKMGKIKPKKMHHKGIYLKQSTFSGCRITISKKGRIHVRQSTPFWGDLISDGIPIPFGIFKRQKLQTKVLTYLRDKYMAG